MQIQNTKIPNSTPETQNGMTVSPTTHTQGCRGVSSTARGKNDEGFSTLLAALMSNVEGAEDIETLEILDNLEAEGEEMDMELPFPVAIPFNLMNFENQNHEVTIEGVQPEIPKEMPKEVPTETINLTEEGETITTLIPKEEIIQKEEPKIPFEKELQIEGEKIDKTPVEVKTQLGEKPDKSPLDEVKISREEQAKDFKSELLNLQPETKEVQNTESKVQGKPIEPAVTKENIQRLNDSIIKLIETTTVDNKSVMKVKLYPEELGTLDLTLEMQEGKLVAKITVDNESVKQLFSDKLGELNQNLTKQNINIQDFKVEVKPEASLDFNSHGEFNQDNREDPKGNRIFGQKGTILEETPTETTNTTTSGELSILA